MNDAILAAVRAGYRRRMVIGAFTAVAFLIGMVRFVFLGSSGYEAQVMLVVTDPPRTSEEAPPLIPSALSPKVYGDMLGSPSLIAGVLDELARKNAFPDEPPVLKDFIEVLQIDVGVIDQTTRPVNYSPLLTLKATAETPELAKAIVDVWARHAVVAARTAHSLQVEQLARALTETEKARKETLDRIRAEEQVELSKLDEETAREELKQLTTLSVELLNTRKTSEQTEAETQARLDTIRANLAGEKPLIELLRAPDDTAYWLLESEKGNQKAYEELRDKGMVSQQLNQVYWSLRDNEQTALSLQATAKSRIVTLDTQLADVQQRIATVQAKLAEHLLTVKRLETDEKVAESIYRLVATDRARYSEASNLIEGVGKDGTDRSIGLNRLSENTAVIEMPSFKNKVMVIAFTFVAFALVTGFLIGLELIQPVLRTLQAGDAGPRAPLAPSDGTSEGA